METKYGIHIAQQLLWYTPYMHLSASLLNILSNPQAGQPNKEESK